MMDPAPVTWRAIGLGVLLAGLINFACPYGVLVLHNAGLTSDYITAGAMMVLFVLAGAINPLLKVLWPRLSLSSGDLIVVYVMMIVASAIPTWGLVTNLFHILTRPFYYATPENNWADMLQPLLPSWLAPRDPSVARFFYEGLPVGTGGIPWGAWFVPLLAWGSFMVAVFLWMVTTMIVLRQPWVERERLSFPLTQLPLEMIRGSDTHVVPPLFRNGLMWLGFSIPFVIQMTRGLHHYHFFVPELTTLFEPIQLFRNSVRLIVFVNFAIIGLAYFLSLQVSFSVWFFHLLSRTQTGIFNIIGFEVKGHNESLTGSSIASSHQGMGAMLALVLAMLWTSRDHLRRVARAAVSRDGDGADGHEILSYRATAWLWVACLIYMTIWLLATGLPPLATAVFLVGSFVIFLAIARVIAQGGIGFTSSTMLPQSFTVYTLGTDLIGWKGLASTGLSYSWAAEMRTTVMASTANGLKLVTGGGIRSHRVFWAILLAILTGLVVASWTTLHLNYTYGGINLRQFGVPGTAWRFVEDKLLNPVGWEYIRPRLLFTAIGAGLMGGLVWAQHHLLWWPLHFIGLPVADSWVMGWAWFSVMVGWLLKAIILRIGGTTAVRTYKPIFFGFIAGQLMGGAVWMIVDIALGETGNRVYIGVP
ncbi:MAG: hypothetical protein HN712_00865 [Gemmatimonadetes bacterium]|jgi:hypothetical protein|nr:hypothetical protein [Gemmatimonadota bacterium]MBT6144937.1 hypothetical protein [Gemmatimonadota bacterium]MBT7858821.1 hypothetical protein [Gemmatimonadota bacterium]